MRRKGECVNIELMTLKIFNDFIRDSELVDVKARNTLFTWCGKDNKHSRLDRALVNWHWSVQGEWEIFVLNRKNSDHRAIILRINSTDWGPKPFKFFDYWLDDAELVRNISKEWLQSGDKDAQGKLRIIKKLLKTWNKESNGNINDQIRSCEQLQFQ